MKKKKAAIKESSLDMSVGMSSVSRPCASTAKGSLAVQRTVDATSMKSLEVQADGECLVYSQDGSPKLEVLMEDETLWLTQKQMAELFAVRENTITYHIKEINACGELEGIPTTRKFRVVRFEGGRTVSRQIEYYNLEMVISVGYRVNSRKGVLFRRWATSVLKEYLKRGSVRDQRIEKLENRMTAAERSINTIIYTLTPPLKENRRRIGFNA